MKAIRPIWYMDIEPMSKCIFAIVLSCVLMVLCIICLIAAIKIKYFKYMNICILGIVVAIVTITIFSIEIATLKNLATIC